MWVLLIAFDDFKFNHTCGRGNRQLISVSWLGKMYHTRGIGNGRTKEVMKRKTEEKKRADQIRMPETKKSVKTHLLWLPPLHHAYVALLL